RVAEQLPLNREVILNSVWHRVLELDATAGRSTTHDEGRIWGIQCPLSISTRKLQDEGGHTGSGFQRAYPVAQVKRSKSTADRCLAVAEHVPGKTNPRLDEVVVVV